MEPDKFEQAWRSQSSHPPVTIDRNLLVTEVQRSHQTFRAKIFRRDFKEVAISLILIPVWFVMGNLMATPWTWYLMVPCLIWTAVFFLFDRIRHPQLPIEAGDSLLDGTKKSLKQVEHQIWLLRNIFWWYLLPPSIAIMAIFFHFSWLDSNSTVGFVTLALGWFLFLVVIYGFVYWVNQRAVRKDLEPRRQELLVLIASLQDEVAVKDVDDDSIQSTNRG